MRYAANTSVSSEKSRMEIEQILVRYGATGFLYGWGSGNATIMFRFNNKNIKFVLPLPDRTDRQFTHTEAKGYERHPDDQRKVYEQAIRQKWRALALSIKAKLETVESGIASFEEEFLSYIIVADGQTVSEWLLPQINDFYLSGKGPRALPDCCPYKFRAGFVHHHVTRIEPGELAVPPFPTQKIKEL